MLGAITAVPSVSHTDSEFDGFMPMPFKRQSWLSTCHAVMQRIQTLARRATTVHYCDAY